MKISRLFMLLAMSALLKYAAISQTQVTFYTSMGDFIVETNDSLAPITAGNFIDLVQKKFYDGVIFHRVIDNFMIQGGDPTGTGSGGPGYKIPDEFDPALSNIQKTISMANSGPNTGGSQFFINLVNNTHLDYNKAPLTSKHPVFGAVISNFNVVQDIGLVVTNGSDRPLTDVVMDSLRITYATWVGLGEKEPLNPEINIYPNPANEVINLAFAHTPDNGFTIRLVSMQGQIMKQLEMDRGSAQMDISLMPTGIYLVQIRSGDYFAYKRLVIY